MPTGKELEDGPVQRAASSCGVLAGVGPPETDDSKRAPRPNCFFARAADGLLGSSRQLTEAQDARKICSRGPRALRVARRRAQSAESLIDLSYCTGGRARRRARDTSPKGVRARARRRRFARVASLRAALVEEARRASRRAADTQGGRAPLRGGRERRAQGSTTTTRRRPLVPRRHGAARGHTRSRLRRVRGRELPLRAGRHAAYPAASEQPRLCSDGRRYAERTSTSTARAASSPA